jgi:preprotein translocase subunit SecE
MSSMKSYLLESWDEFITKAYWPKFNDLQKSGVLVVVASIIFALVIFAMDKAISSLLEVVYDIFRV